MGRSGKGVLKLWPDHGPSRSAHDKQFKEHPQGPSTRVPNGRCRTNNILNNGFFKRRGRKVQKKKTGVHQNFKTTTGGRGAGGGKGSTTHGNDDRDPPLRQILKGIESWPRPGTKKLYGVQSAVEGNLPSPTYKRNAAHQGSWRFQTGKGGRSRGEGPREMGEATGYRNPPKVHPDRPTTRLAAGEKIPGKRHQGIVIS